jgi:hypothetical protein
VSRAGGTTAAIQGEQRAGWIRIRHKIFFIPVVRLSLLLQMNGVNWMKSEKKRSFSTLCTFCQGYSMAAILFSGQWSTRTAALLQARKWVRLLIAIRMEQIQEKALYAGSSSI